MKGLRMRMKMVPVILVATLIATLGAGKKPSLTLDQVPQAVKDALLAQGPAESIQSLRARVHKESATYSAKVSNEGKTYQLSVAADGTILHKELTDEEMSPAPLHPEDAGAAKDAINKEAPGDAVKNIQAVYEMHVTVNGKVYYMRVRGDGTVLERDLDQERTDALHAHDDVAPAATMP